MSVSKMPMALKPYLNTIMTGGKINVANLMVLESVEKKTVSCIKEIGNMDNHMVKEHNGQVAVVGTRDLLPMQTKKAKALNGMPAATCTKAVSKDIKEQNPGVCFGWRRASLF